MQDTTAERIREILPDFDALPSLLSPEQTADIIGLKVQTLAADRCGPQRLGLPYTKVGRLVRYSKTAVAKWLLSNTQAAATR